MENLSIFLHFIPGFDLVGVWLVYLSILYIYIYTLRV